MLSGMPTSDAQVYKNRTCNMCGKEFDLWDSQEDFSIHKTIGYGSKFDGAEIEINLCCGCFDSLIEKVLPQIKGKPILSWQ
jgi:hypothetical protein